MNVFHGLLEIAGLEPVVGEESEHPSAPGPVVERGRERLGLFQDADEAAKLRETEQRGPQVEPDVDRLLVSLATGGKMVDGAECLIEPCHRLAARGLRGRSQPGLPRKPRRLLPQLAAQAVVREPLDLLSARYWGV